MLQGTRRRIVEALLDESPLPLLATARAAGVSSPTALRHLEILQTAGLVERTLRGPGAPVYSLRSFQEATWLDPQQGLLRSWRTNPAAGARFPWVARVPDRPAQESLLPFLEAAEWNGYFHPPPRKGQGRPARPDGRNGVTLAVFGSCARGDAGKGSDVDLLVIEPRRARLERRLRTLAARIDGDTPRRLDLHVVQRDRLDRLHGGMRRSLREEGITVHTTVPGGEVVEALWTWKAHDAGSRRDPRPRQ